MASLFVDNETVKYILSYVLLFSFYAQAQAPTFVPTAAPLPVQAQPTQMEIYMRQMYPQYITPQQQQLQMATLSPQDRLRLMQTVNLGNNNYAVQVVPQSGPHMGQTMWVNQTPQNPLLNFFTAMGAMTKFPERADRVEAREPIRAYVSPDPEERTTPARSAVETMNTATNKLKTIKNPKPADCLDCITDPLPTEKAGPVKGTGTIKTSAVGGVKEDLSADIKCSYTGDIISGIRLTFAATVEAKIVNNKVVAFKYIATEGNKRCVIDLANFPQKKVGNTTNVVLEHANKNTFVSIYPNNKSPDRKNPSVQIGINFYNKVCPQMSQKWYMQIEADPKTGTCR